MARVWARGWSCAVTVAPVRCLWCIWMLICVFEGASCRSRCVHTASPSMSMDHLTNAPTTEALVLRLCGKPRKVNKHVRNNQGFVIFAAQFKTLTENPRIGAEF
jgi:hypothetical protein